VVQVRQWVDRALALDRGVPNEHGFSSSVTDIFNIIQQVLQVVRELEKALVPKTGV
jgi:hypothetical protein